MKTPEPMPGETESKVLCELYGEGFKCVALQFFPSLRVAFIADGDIDADGAYRAYHPQNRPGLDDLRNAGRPGNWFGVVTDRNGVPFVQGPKDPAPGFYVSATSYQWPDFAKNDPRRYVDSERVPFIVVEDYIRRRAKGKVLGCASRVTDLRTDRKVDTATIDMGPLNKLGELSIAAARGIGINGDPRRGGVDEPVLLYELWPDRPAVIDGVTYPLIPLKA